MPEAGVQRNRDPVGWVYRGLVAVVFIAFGLDKFGGGSDSEWVRIFARIGFGQWFRVATGVIEITGAVLYVFPWTLRVGTVLLSGTMLGAILAHFTRLGDPFSSIIPAALLAAVVIVALREPPVDIKQLMQSGRDRARAPH